MKKNIYIFLILITISCSSSKNIMQHDNSMYRINKITNRNSWHIIYAERNDSIFKIVVSKDKEGNRSNCCKILVGNYYDLDLKSRKKNIPVIGGVKLKPMNHLDVQSYSYEKDGVECYLYDKKTEICTEPHYGIYDIYYTVDLRGLCYLKKTDEVGLQPASCKDERVYNLR